MKRLKEGVFKGMCKLTDKQLELAKELYSRGETYHDISICFKDVYGIDISSESLRYYITRKNKPKMSKVEQLRGNGLEKVLVISDLHIPYQREDILDIINKHKDEVTTLILGGDIIDCFKISSFPKLNAPSLTYEMSSCHKLLKEIQDILPNANKILIFGNHEERWKRYLGKVQSEVNSLHSSNILYEIVKGFEVHDRQRGTTTFYEPLDYSVIDNWWVQYNDMIVCHPITFSRVAAKTSQMAIDYFYERGLDFQSVLVAHTHKISSCMKFDKFAIEIGCMCKTQEYSEAGKLTYSPQCNGYYLATFVHGKFDINQSKNYVIK